MLGAEVLLATSDILETIVTRQSDTFPPFPKELFHYATLETIQKIFEFDDLRLSHAAYSNDQRELAQAKEVISNRLRNYSGSRNAWLKILMLQRLT
jgi:hypothetical protein